MFDLSINLGNILTIFTFIVGGIVFVDRIKNDGKILAVRHDALDKKLDGFETEIKKLNEVFVRFATTDGRIANIENRQLAEGVRLDSMEVRFNKVVDQKARA